jgi:lipid A 3-O-deacylase
MASKLGTCLVGAAALACVAGPAPAADFPASPTAYTVPQPSVGPFGLLSEVRGGVFYHGYDTPEAGLVDLNAELISPRVVETNTGYWNLLIPRLHLGGNLNTSGRTSDVYTGLTWTFPLYWRLFGEITLGGSYNDGHTEFVPPRGYSAVGCHLMFRESASLGFQIDEHWSVLATAEHISNDHLCDRNAGMTNFGGRIAYHF